MATFLLSRALIHFETPYSGAHADSRDGNISWALFAPTLSRGKGKQMPLTFILLYSILDKMFASDPLPGITLGHPTSISTAVYSPFPSSDSVDALSSLPALRNPLIRRQRTSRFARLLYMDY